MQTSPIAAAALSSFRAAAVRLQNAGANIASLGTEGYQALRTEQISEPSTGPRAITLRSDEPVDAATEAIDITRARSQAMMALRILAMNDDHEAGLLDVFA